MANRGCSGRGAVIEDFGVFEHAAAHGVGVGAVGGEGLIGADQQVHGQQEAFDDGAADGVTAPGRLDAGAKHHDQVQVVVLVLFATGDAAEEDDLLGVEALGDELGDGFDGFAVEEIFDDWLRLG